MRYNYFILILLYYSCSNHQDELNRIPIVDVLWRIEQDNSFYNEKVKINRTAIFDQLIANRPEIDSLYGLARFKIAEMDSSQLRPFDLYLLESKSQNDSKWHLLTANKEDTHIIDKYDFDPDSLDMREIYQHSSKLDHDGIAITLIEDASTQDSLIFYDHYLEVFETGEIKLISKTASYKEIFKVLTSDQRSTGSYSCYENDVKIELDLKDGLTPENYSYKLDIFTPEGCFHIYQHIDSRIIGNSIVLDSSGNFKLIIKEETIDIVHSNFDSACEDFSELNYELKKSDDNK